MQTDTAYYENLIHRYLAGEADIREAEQLSQWLKEDESHYADFLAFRKAWNLVRDHSLAHQTDLDAEWKEMSHRLNIAPPVALPVRKASNRMIFRQSMRIAASLIILLGLAFAIRLALKSTENHVLAAKQGNREILLPDGSIATLSEGSQLTYPEHFGRKTREVSLVGEAYFEVAHDAAHPFIVNTDGFDVKVTGTSFSVNTLKKETAGRVQLTEGHVQITLDSHSNPINLNPGEQADVHLDGIVVAPIADPNYMAWKTREIVFDNTPLPEVTSTLSKVYHTSITLGNTLNGQSLTATFRQEELANVLKVICTTLDLEYTLNEQGIVMTGKPRK